MKYINLMVSIAFIACIQGCTDIKTMEISAVELPEQQVGYRETITSRKNHFVSVAPYRVQSFNHSRASFILCVKNCGNSPIEISPRDITVKFIECADDGVPRNIDIPIAGDLTFPPEKDLLNIETPADRNSRPRMIHYANLIGNTTYCTWRLDQPEKSLLRTIANQYLPGSQKERAGYLYFRARNLLPGESEDGLLIGDTGAMPPGITGTFQLVVSVNGEQHEFNFHRSLSI